MEEVNRVIGRVTLLLVLFLLDRRKRRRREGKGV